MKLQNLDLQPLDIEQLKKEILSEYTQEAIPESKEIENDLADLYLKAFTANASPFFNLSEATKENLTAEYAGALAGSGIWQRVRRIICKILNHASTAEEIIDAILEALASVIPGGIILKKIAMKILRYILNQGVLAFCSID